MTSAPRREGTTVAITQTLFHDMTERIDSLITERDRAVADAQMWSAAHTQAMLERDRAVKERDELQERFDTALQGPLDRVTALEGETERLRAAARAVHKPHPIASMEHCKRPECVILSPALSGETRDRDADFWTEHRAWLSGETESP